VVVEQSPKKQFLHRKKCWKKIVEVEPWEKNRTSVVYSPGPVFDVKKILDKLLPTK